MRRPASFASGVVVGLLCGVVLAGGASTVRAADPDGAYKKLRIFAQVLTYVQQNYVDVLDGEELVYDAVQGLLSGLDPHSTFLRASEFEKLREDTAGEFGGLGIEVSPGSEINPAERVVVIDVVHKDGPGAHAGLKVGDRIVTVDGEPVRGAPVEAAVRLMRGVPGTRVVLGIERAGWPEARDVPLVRRQVRVPSVAVDSLDVPGVGEVGYIQIRAFQERTDDEVGQALAELRRRQRAHGGARLPGLILDLRDNPGGLLDEGVKVADRFVRDGVIVSTQGRTARNTERELAHEDGTEPDYPVVVVVNGGTASASEIVAGALQDHRRAWLVGERSFGKGSVQTLFGLEDGSGLKLTIARYFTPSGRSIQDTGIQPDAPVRGLRDAVGRGVRADDAQIQAAVQAIRRPPAQLAWNGHR